MGISWRFGAAVFLSLASYLVAPLPAVDFGAPGEIDEVVALVNSASPGLYRFFYGAYFVTPGLFFIIVSLIVESVIRVWMSSFNERRTRGKLPPWPTSIHDENPALVVGEIHYQTELKEHPHPRWCVMPEKGLYTGLMILGAVGTGKTAGAMKPFTRQLLEWQAHDTEKRCAALVLEVKGDFCYEVQSILNDNNRFEDYLELSLSADANMWNPLACAWLDTYTLAYTLASLINQLFGAGKEPFWQQAYTNTVRWIIESFRTFDDPWFTLGDLHRTMVDAKELKKLILAQEAFIYDKYRFQINLPAVVYNKWKDRLASVTITVPDMKQSRSLPSNRRISPMAFSLEEGEQDILAESTGGERPSKKFDYKWYENAGCYSTVVGDLDGGVLRWEMNKELAPIPYEQATLSEPTKNQLELVVQIKRWYDGEWLGLDEKLRSSIVVGMSVFLGIFVVPETARIFCPPRPDSMSEKERANLVPPLDEVIESGRVFALNMPAGANAALARAVGVMLKSSWLSTLLLRPKRMKLDIEAAKKEGREPKYWRPAVFICDEYQAFVTCGESDPSGDEKAFALTRQSRCIPIVATQSIVSLRSVLGEGEAWRALLQTLRSRIFLSLADDFSQKTASELLGQVDRMKASYSLSENTGKASVSLLTGRVGGSQASAGISKSYAHSREPLFHPRDFSLQKLCQGICQIFDGNAVIDATRIYLKPDFIPRDVPYWRSLGAKDVV